jgi:hypothetical protein
MVVLSWMAANLVLAAIMPAFSESPFAVILYFVASVPLLVFALAVAFLGGRNAQASRTFTLVGGAQWVPVIALGAVAVGAGIIFGAALIAVGAAVTAIGVVMLARASRRTR